MNDLFEMLDRAHKLDESLTVKRDTLKEDFDEVGTYTYRYIPEDPIDYVFHGVEIDDDEFDAAVESGNFTPEMWLTSEACITEEDGWYQVSLGGMDDYTEFETVEECKEYVEGHYEHFEWVD